MAKITTKRPPAKRGKVSKSYRQVRVLSGFMDDPHFRGFAQEHLVSITSRQQASLLKKVERTRATVAKLAAHSDFSAVVRPIDPSAYAGIVKDKAFNEVFGGRQYRFAWVKPENLVALQVSVNAQQEEVPTDEAGLIDFAFPSDWKVPTEISFIPPQGPIYIVTSSPQMAGLQMSMDDKKGQVIISPPLHINLIQVMQFGGRYYLKNGYHRIVGALAEGVKEIPALVVDAIHPDEVALPPNMGFAAFKAAYLMGLARPPLVSDFNGTATVEISMREKRYGASVSLQISPVNIGV